MTLHIKKFSHNFAVENPHSKYITYIEEFCKQYLLQINYYKAWDGTVRSNIAKVFAVRTMNKSEYRFHIGHFDMFIDFMGSKGFTDVKVTEIPMYTPADAEFKIITDKTPRDEQPQLIDYLVGEGKKKVLVAQTGQGKCEVNGTPVRTLNGWTPIEQLRVGDLVMNEFGGFNKVTGVFPQGEVELYKLTFEDSRTSVVGGDHLWHIQYNEFVDKTGGFISRKQNIVVSTKDIFNNRDNIETGHQIYQIPVINPDGDDSQFVKPLGVDMWLMGGLMAYGTTGTINGSGAGINNRVFVLKYHSEEYGYHLRNALDKLSVRYNINKTTECSLKIASVGTLSLIRTEPTAPEWSCVIHEFANRDFFKLLEDIGNPFGVNIEDRVFPDKIMFACNDDRKDFVKGIIEHSGYISDWGSIELKLVSDSMSRQFMELADSIGLSITARHGTEVSIDKPRIDFFKTEVLNNRLIEFYTEDNFSGLQISRISSYGTGEATCISVDNPSRLYVTKDYIVTHNTFMSLMAVANMGKRVLLSIKPMYIKRWLDDVASSEGVFHLDKKELVVIQGSKALASVIQMALNNKLNYKFIIISNKTLSIYYKEYLTGVSMEKYCNVKPQNLMETLGIGVRIIDEAHQDFHQCFKTDLFSHVPKTIELSATLTPDDKFLKRMYQTMYPLEVRKGGDVYVKYVNVVSVPFKIDTSVKSKIRYNNRGMLSYSHGSFEESVMNSQKRLDNFLYMVNELAKKFFIDVRYAKNKLLIFASRVEMCRTIAEYLQPIYPNLKITKYTQEDDYEVLKDADIIVSTPGSAGTAVDIPSLQTCIATVAVGDTKLNLQMIGRLRQLRDQPIKPTYVYTYCTDIEKQVEYHNKKRNVIFANRALSQTDLTPAIYRV